MVGADQSLSCTRKSFIFAEESLLSIATRASRHSIGRIYFRVSIPLFQIIGDHFTSLDNQEAIRIIECLTKRAVENRVAAGSFKNLFGKNVMKQYAQNYCLDPVLMGSNVLFID